MRVRILSPPLVLTSSSRPAVIDAYLITIGAAGIIWMFPVIFLDQFVHNALISRVWLESVWLCLAWILNLGMSAYSAPTGFILTLSKLAPRLPLPYCHQRCAPHLVSSS